MRPSVSDGAVHGELSGYGAHYLRHGSDESGCHTSGIRLSLRERQVAELCAKCNIKFIGPSADIINKMGNKSEARKTMMEAGVPVVPGSKEPVYTAKEALVLAQSVGFPVMIKASSGGGGKGMRISRGAEDFEANFNQAQMESVKGFSDDTMYIESILSSRGISNSRYWPIHTEMWFIWGSATALSREGIRRFWRNRRQSPSRMI